MARIIFASHGGLAKGMKDSVSMIAGDLSNDIETYSLYPGENPRDFYLKLYEELKDSNEQTIILADIKGGSVHTALVPLTDLKNVVLLSGMNMGMALDVVLRYKDGITESDYEGLLEVAKSGITLMDGVQSEEDEEF